MHAKIAPIFTEIALIWVMSVAGLLSITHRPVCVLQIQDNACVKVKEVAHAYI